MIKYLILFAFVLSSLVVESQNWDSIRGGITNDQVEGVIFDSIHNELIISGKFINKVGNLPARGIARWNGLKWDTMCGGINTHNIQLNPNTPGGMVLCGIPYNGKLLVGGCFNSIGGINATSLALWDGNKWDSLPKRAFNFNSPAPPITGFFKKGNIIYLCGSFTSIDGMPAKGLATWDGFNFTPVPTFTFNSFISINNIIEYQNQLYISGGYFYNPPAYVDNSDILKFDGTKWNSMIPGGIKGFNGATGSMAIFNNELYIGGHFLASDGNPGNNIMKWNGSQWQDVGFGGGSASYVRKLLVKNNKLWAFGCFNTVANMPTYNANVAVYDGIMWCALQDSLDNCLLAADIYNDTIYIGGAFWSAGGDSHITNLAKMKSETLYKSCNGVGINELYSQNSINFYPNPVLNTLHIESEKHFEAGTEIEILNTLGQTVLKQSFNKEIDLTTLSSGYYTLKIISPNTSPVISKFIKE